MNTSAVIELVVTYKELCILKVALLELKENNHMEGEQGGRVDNLLEDVESCKEQLRRG